MPMNEEFLTQDIDILPSEDNETNNSNTDILPELEINPEENNNTENSTNTDVEVKEENKDEELDSELAELLAGLEESTEQSGKDSDTATEAVSDAKEKIEEMKEDPESGDLVKEIYQDLLKAETSLQASDIAREIAVNKVTELQTELAELQINAAGQNTINHPDVMIINNLLEAAEGGSDVALPKVKKALTKLYQSLTGETIEEGQVSENLQGVSQGDISLNESTMPTGSIETEKEAVDVDEITSILG